MTPRQILGVGPTATEDECKAAFRKLARQYHPDVNKAPGAEERFKAISEAWEVIQRPDSASNRRASARTAYAHTSYARSSYYWTPPRSSSRMEREWAVKGATRKLQAVINELSEWSSQRGYQCQITIVNDKHITIRLVADDAACHLVHEWLVATVAPRYTPPQRPRYHTPPPAKPKRVVHEDPAYVTIPVGAVILVGALVAFVLALIVSLFL